MAKRAYSESQLQSEEESGYIGKVSDLLTFKKMNRYFEGNLQTKTKSYRFIGFNVDKHAEFVNAEKMSSPIKLSNYRLSPDRNGNLEIILNKHSKMEYVKSLPFRRRIEFDEEGASRSNPKPLEYSVLSNIDCSKTHQMYNVEAKVVDMDTKEEEVSLFGTPKKKLDIIIADSTGSIKLTLWEDIIKKVEKGKTYKFTNVGTRNYEEFKLTSTANTIVSQSDDIEIVSEEEIANCCTKISGRIEQVQCIKKKKCPVCDKSLIWEEGATKIKCSSCNLKSHASSVKESVMCRFNVKDEFKKTHAVVVFHTALTNFLTEEGKLDLFENIDQLEDYFLDLPRVTCAIKNDGVVSSLSC